MLLATLGNAPVSAQVYDSPYWRTPDGNLDADQQEYSTDKGGLLYDDVLKDLITGSPFNWDNPSPTIDPNALATFSWLDASVLTLCVDFRDPVLDTTTTVEYDYRRYQLMGTRGVVFYPKDFFDVTCGQGPDRTVDLFIDCRATAGTLHDPPETNLSVQPDACSTHPDGPGLPSIGVVSMLRSLPYRGTSDSYSVFVLDYGTTGGHPIWRHVQRNLILREVFIAQGQDTGFCYDVRATYLLGQSYGSGVAFASQLLYPNEFRGTLVLGVNGVIAQHLFGHGRYFRMGLVALNSGASPAAGDREAFEDAWTIGNTQSIIDASPSGGGSRSWALNNVSLLERLEARIPGHDANDPLLTRPIMPFLNDEDEVTFAHLYRHRLEQVASENVPSTLGGGTYDQYLKPLTVPFVTHSARYSEVNGILLYPATYYNDTTIPSGGNVIDWLLSRAGAMETAFATYWNGSPSNPLIDIGVPEPTTASDYVTHDATIGSPGPEVTNGLDLDRLWSIGRGDQPGYLDNARAFKVAWPGQGSKQFYAYGDNSGFVHIFEYDNSTDRFVNEWKSPDLGTGVCDLELGTFADGKGLVVATVSGELWIIELGFSGHTTRKIDDGTNDPVFQYAGEREIPMIAVGPLSEGVTPLYVVGSGHTSPVTGKPHPCRLWRLELTSVVPSASNPTLAHYEPMEPVSDLEFSDGRLIATTMRGFVYQIEYSTSPSNFVFRSGVGFEGLGDYLKMAPRSVEVVTLGSSSYALVAGQPGDPNVTGNQTMRGLLAIDLSTGSVVATKLTQGALGNTPTEYLPATCLEVIDTSGSKARVAVGTVEGVHFYDFDASVNQFTDVPTVQTQALTRWSPLLKNTAVSPVYRPSFILSLEYFTAIQLGGGGGLFGPESGPSVEVRGRLVGTTAEGVVFVHDLSPGFNDLQEFPTTVQSMEPFTGAWGLKITDRAVPATQSHGCPSNEPLSINATSHFSYFEPFNTPDLDTAGAAFYKLDPWTGAVFCRRPCAVSVHAFNPERRDPSTIPLPDKNKLAWDVFWNDLFLNGDVHVFTESVDVGDLHLAAQDDEVDLARTPPAGLLDGKLSITTDYLGTSSPKILPSGSTPLLDDRFYASGYRGPSAGSNDRFFGNAVRIGNILPTGRDEIIMTTNGGRIVLAQADTATPPNYTTWTSWGSNLPTSSAGDYGYKLAGLALYDVDGNDGGLQEVYAVGADYTDPASPQSDTSRLLVFENGSGVSLQLTASTDLGEAACLGLWVGPALGEPESTGDLHLIVGRSQSFAVYLLSPVTKTVSTLLHESEGLGTHVGAFNSIHVHKGADGPTPGRRSI